MNRGNRIRSTQELLESTRVKPKHYILQLLAEHGFDEVKELEHGNVRIVSKGPEFPRLHLHFFDRNLFLSAYIHEAADRNIGKVKEPGLRGWVEGRLCLNEHAEYGLQSRYCKRFASHDGRCLDADGPFPAIEEAS